MPHEALATAQIAVLIESNSEIKVAIVDTNKSLSLLLQSQTRLEERQIADRDWQKKVEAHQDKQDDKIETVENTANQALHQTKSNGKWIALGVTVISGCLIWIAKTLLTAQAGLV